MILHAPPIIADQEHLTPGSQRAARQEDFRLPVPGRKMELTSLLVIVPTLLTDVVTSKHKPPALCDPARIRPLQHKLVDRLRNVDAHTYADFSERDARLLIDLCAEWLEAMALLAGFGTTSSLPINCNAPSVESLSVLLYGGGEAQAQISRR